MNRRDVRVYVAGPLTGADPSPSSYIGNVHRMVKVAIDIHAMGVSPYVPALDFLMGAVAGDWSIQDYYEMSESWLKAAHVMFRMSGESKGADAEAVVAQEHDIPVVTNFDVLEHIVRALTAEGGG